MVEQRRWFYDQLHANGISLRKLARMLEVDPSALSLAFRGRRRITMGEAVQIARIFNAPLEDVYRAAGLQVPNSAGLIAIVGIVGPDMLVGPTTDKARVPAPPGIPEGSEAVQFRTAQSPADLWDRWIAFFDPRPSSDIAGRLCLVTLADGSRHVRAVRPGYLPKTYNLQSPFAPPLESVAIQSATPILWMQQP